jgi:hypothetical protein
MFFRFAAAGVPLDCMLLVATGDFISKISYESERQSVRGSSRISTVLPLSKCGLPANMMKLFANRKLRVLEIGHVRFGSEADMQI